MPALKDKIRITHLTFSGGGTHGAVLVGGLRFLYLEGLHTNITHLSCCSVGCFVAIMFCFKFSIEEMEETIKSLVAYNKFSFIPKSNYLKIFNNLGLSSTDILIDHLISKIREKYKEYTTNEELENITFMDISKRFGINLYISTTCLNTCQGKTFSIEDTPDAKVFQVCRASMSIPFLYKPVEINGEYYVDGGMSNNFPISVFKNVPDENKLGLALCSGKDENKPIDTNEKPSLFFILCRVSTIIRNIFREKVFLSHLNNVSVLKYDNIPASWIAYEVQKTGLRIFKVSLEELNEMFIFGFHHMMLYMQYRENVVDAKHANYIRLIDDDTNKNTDESKDCPDV